MSVPELRLAQRHEGAPLSDRAFVLYWMTAARRLEHSFALDHAVSLAVKLKKPLVILEPLRVGYRWASDRFHRFVLDGMEEHAAALADTPVHYYPYVERTPGEGRGLLAQLSKDAAIVVADEWPCFFLPHAVDAAARVVEAPLVTVDGAGLLPLRAADRCFSMAMHFRGWLKKNLLPHLQVMPSAAPLTALTGSRRALPALTAAKKRWPEADLGADLASLPIDHQVGVTNTRGGRSEARARLDRFLAKGVARYDELRNDPDVEGSSALSAHLHFGHLGTHEIAAALWGKAGPERLFKPTEERWNLSRGASEYFDQLLVWRELGLNFCHHRQDYDQYRSLPDWAQETLKKHRRDPRPHRYSLEALESASTGDRIWNAAQRQLVEEGIIHNHLRMLWGKKVLEWSAEPEAAVEILVHLNNKYALDGRDPNSYSGIFWCFGRYDRPWPERPIFGMVRSMSSERAAKKVQLEQYLRRFSGGAGQGDLFAPPTGRSRR
ncbi:MAG: deoxyribodipyrimidine photolyase [Myxococcota bacterium]